MGAYRKFSYEMFIRSVSWWGVVIGVILCLQLTSRAYAIDIDVNNDDSIRAAARDAAFNLQTWYNGNQTGGEPGKFPYPPYYWWLSGVAFWLFGALSAAEYGWPEPPEPYPSWIQICDN